MSFGLAPAELPKQVASFDLPISLGLLAASGQFSSERFSQYAVVGELALEGTRPIKGALSMAMAVCDLGLKGLLIPRENAAEAAVASEIDVIPINSLTESVGFFVGSLEIDAQPSELTKLFEEFAQYAVDFSDVRGQEMSKRALSIASLGLHNILMLGPI
ncbi:MAG: magnesium chelatase domain-containing protein [Pirellulales bacterium]